MATLAANSTQALTFNSFETVNVVSNFGQNWRYSFAPSNAESPPPVASSRSFGPAAQNVTIGPFSQPGTFTLYNDSGLSLTYTQNNPSQTFNNAFTNGLLTANGAVALSPSNANVTISPTGTGTVTINPATLSNIDNCRIGANTRAIGIFTLLGLNHGDLSGTPGNATMTTPKGRNAIAAGSNNVVITNAVCTATSTVFAVIAQATADATLTQIVRVVPAAGSFTIYGNANATANTVVDWLIIQS